ncbi:hypothetical protein KIN20_024868 [Parelaphostrongylus tenuis]|uniref:Uncharacterized protein n=1 Tax=Parelaphostrongylus tenuis TaxID=148309 RepID=A0AAD5QWJ9_PARTN|nr:hypothetical protein KIN20_024868 [Parelaphostrongylus tenuis]
MRCIRKQWDLICLPSRTFTQSTYTTDATKNAASQHPPGALTEDFLTLEIVPFVPVRVVTVALYVTNEWERWYERAL